jgi:cytochrome P450
MMMTATHDTPAPIASRLVDPQAYAEALQLQEDFRWLRSNLPVSLATVSSFDPFWVITKHADISEISRQNAIFHNGERPPTLVDRIAQATVRKLTGRQHLVRSLVQMDAPDHPKYRALTQAWFTHANLKKLEQRIRTIARSHVERMLASGGQCDFVSDVAADYPLRVIMEILGVPPEDEARMLVLTQQLFGSQDPELNRSRQASMDMEQLARQLQAVVADFSDYFRKLTLARRAEPRDDVATVIANGQIDGRPIDDFEAMSYYIIIATAGHDTTSSSTCGAMWALCEQPGELAKLRANPELIPGLVEEAVRWTVPVQHFMRTAMQDYPLRDAVIRAGDWLMLCYLSGNRDEEVFEEPFKFRSDRNPNKHISYGTGAHACLGQHLARMEMRILFEELIPRLASVELTGTPRRSASNFVSGPKTLPIRFALS